MTENPIIARCKAHYHEVDDIYMGLPMQTGDTPLKFHLRYIRYYANLDEIHKTGCFAVVLLKECSSSTKKHSDILEETIAKVEMYSELSEFLPKLKQISAKNAFMNYKKVISRLPFPQEVIDIIIGMTHSIDEMHTRITKNRGAEMRKIGETKLFAKVARDAYLAATYHERVQAIYKTEKARLDKIYYESVARKQQQQQLQQQHQVYNGPMYYTPAPVYYY